MFEVKKIENKSLNLDVQGQGCWDDCQHPGHWNQNTSTSTAGCRYDGPYFDCISSCFL